MWTSHIEIFRFFVYTIYAKYYEYIDFIYLIHHQCFFPYFYRKDLNLCLGKHYVPSGRK